MKALLVIGLGNPLMGDEGVGWHVADELVGDPRLPADAEVVCGGTDLLRCAALMERRRRVVVIDALQDDAEPGSVWKFEDRAPWGAGAPAGQPLSELADQQFNAHGLSAVQAILLLRTTVTAPITLLGISICRAGGNPGLSPELAVRMQAIADRVLQELE